MNDFRTFERKLGLNFKNPNLLLQAFVHRSYVNENRGFKLGHNERLEFLGDAVLELAVTDKLYKTYPDKSEGELTAVRSAVVNTKSLSFTAKRLEMDKYLLLSRGEANGTVRARSYILANTYEAVVGAIHTDSGFEESYKFIEKTLFSKIQPIVEEKLWIDPKSLLQEKSQESYGATPEYRLLEESGPDHDKKFTMGVYIDENLMGKGTGASKQDAEQIAARSALEDRGWI